MQVRVHGYVIYAKGARPRHVLVSNLMAVMVRVPALHDCPGLDLGQNKDSFIHIYLWVGRQPGKSSNEMHFPV